MEEEVCPVADLPPGTVTGAGDYAVANRDGEFFAVSRRCRHMGADLAKGRLGEDGRLVCPRHGSTYDLETGQMRRGPQRIYAKIPLLESVYRGFTKTFPLRRRKVVERDGTLYLQ